MTKEELKRKLACEAEYYVASHRHHKIFTVADVNNIAIGFTEKCLTKVTKELQEENAKLKKNSEENQDLATITYMQGASKNKVKLDEATEIIKELLSSCFGYNSKTVNYEVKAKAEAFLKECKNA